MAEPSRTLAPMVRFGPFELDLDGGELRKNGRIVKLQDQPFRILAALVSRPRQIVAREELRSQLWPSRTFVDFEHGLNRAVAKLREVLGDSAETPIYIETLPKRGYRFIAAIDGFVQHPQEAAGIPTPTSHHRFLTWPFKRIAFLFMVASLIGAAGYVAHTGSGNRARPASKVMLAVLPFENMSADPQQDYFSEGLTDEIITDLGGLQPERLGVIARTSVMTYQHSNKNIEQIGRELGADYVLEGGVSRGEKEARVNAQLIQVRDQTHLWAESYEVELGDLLKVQDEVAAKIAGQVQLKFSSELQTRLTDHPRIDPEAHEAYLKGRYFWNRRTQDSYLEALKYFREAIARDPNFAKAYAGLADTLALLGSLPDPAIPRREAMPQAKAAAMRALELDESLADAHTSLAFVRMHYDWDWTGSEKEYQRAIQLNPSYATAHEWRAYLLMATGQPDAAIAEISQARRLDPLSLIINTDFAELLNYARNHDAAIEQLQRTLEMDPEFMLAHATLALSYLGKGGLSESQTELMKVLKLPGGNSFLPALGVVLAKSGRREDAKAIERKLEASLTPGRVRPYPLASLYAALGEKDKAFAVLEESYNDRQGSLILMKVDPAWDLLRTDPRFAKLVHRIGL